MSEQQLVYTKDEVETYLVRSKYAIEDKHSRFIIQELREVDKNRNIRYTNQYTVSQLFPDDNPVDVLKKEIASLTVRNYMHSLKDTRFKNRSDFYVFAKKYDEYVYIKIRVELISQTGAYIYVMSFHYSDKLIDDSCFPYLD